MAAELAYFKAFRVWNIPDKSYHANLLALRGLEASGVYGIYSTGGKLLYVGESHSGQLFDTITRHFREWEVGPDDAQGRRRGGTTYKRGGVKLAFVVTRADEAQDLQLDMIRRLSPRDNVLDGRSVAPLPNPGGRSKPWCVFPVGRFVQPYPTSRHTEKAAALRAMAEQRRFYGGAWEVRREDDPPGSGKRRSSAPAPNRPRRSGRKSKARKSKGRKARRPVARWWASGVKWWAQAAQLKGGRVLYSAVSGELPSPGFASLAYAGPFASKTHALAAAREWHRTGKRPALVRRNPPPLTRATRMGKITAVEYVHADDGLTYRHDFKGRARLVGPSGAPVMVEGPGVRVVRDRGQAFIEG